MMPSVEQGETIMGLCSTQNISHEVLRRRWTHLLDIIKLSELVNIGKDRIPSGSR